MNSITASTPDTASAEVTQAFAALDQARTELRRTADDCNAERRALRRFAYKHDLKLKQARSWMRDHQNEEYLVLIRAELAHDRALREFRRVAMIAALTRVVDTDRRLRAA